MRTIIHKIHSPYRKFRKKLNRKLKNDLLIQRNIWLLIVLARVLSLLDLFLNHYRQQ
jgi:hypothetical protein